LTGRKAWDTYSAAEIATHYLSNHHSLDIVVCLSFRERPGPLGDALGHELEFVVEVFDSLNCRAADLAER
jgi:hypothetical protein